MKPTTTTDKMSALWRKHARRDTASIFGDILAMSESHMDVADRIIEAGGYDPAAAVPEEVQDQINDLAVSADDTESGRVRESLGRWTSPVNGSRRFVIESE